MLIQEYQQRWEADFNNIKKVIEGAFPALEIRVEHVGSTAIQGLASKPIIDIDLVYDKNVSFDRIKKGLETLAYFHNGDQGIKGREVFKRKDSGEKYSILDFVQHHLYVCAIENREFQRHITFRDYLRKHEKERREYESIKFEIAERANQDRKTYAGLKETAATEFVESILKKAQEDKI